MQLMENLAMNVREWTQKNILSNSSKGTKE